MNQRAETPFTLRLRRAVQACRDLKPPYSPLDFEGMLNDCGGDFVPRAKKMLREDIHDGLRKLAKRNKSELSLEWIIAHEPEWNDLFSDEDRKLAVDRLRIAPDLPPASRR